MQYRAVLRQGYAFTAYLSPLPIVRSLLGVIFAFVVFGIFLTVIGRDPIDAYSKFFDGTLGSKLGLSEIGVLMIPFVLTGLAAAVPARVGLINVGGEGQLYIGAWSATGVALFLGVDQIWLMIPLMAAGGFVGGALWGGIAVLLRSWRGVNEVISTLLMNYVAISFVDIFVFGPWKNTDAQNFPDTADFGAEAVLPAIAGTRLHLGLLLPVIAVLVIYLVLSRTRWGYNMRAIGGNTEAARRRGIPVARYLVVAMLVGGGLAGLAGMSEVSGIQHDLRQNISNNLGFLGFLASWMAGHNPVTLIATSFLIALVIVGGPVLQISIHVPSAAMFILVALVLFAVLGFRRVERARA